MEKPFIGAAERNKEYIVEHLTEIFSDFTTVLEVGSGTGQHAVYFASQLKHLFWQPSDLSERLPGIAAWCEESLTENIFKPMELDISAWPNFTEKYDAVFASNVIHYIESRYVDKFFEGSKNEGLRDRLKAIVETPFKRLEYTEAISVLQKEMKAGRAKFENTDVTWGIDLDSEHERYLTEKVYKGPVVLINYPKDIKAFYMKLNADGKTVAAMDILVPRIGEIIGGSQREDSLEVLEERAKSVGLNPEDIKWYGVLRQYGSVPHAGFGLGFERLVMLCSGVENIRDVIPFPRTPGNCRF